VKETTYIKKHEVECKCGCGIAHVSQSLIDRLNTVRILTEQPIILNSVCRCLEHNKNVGGSSTSSHISTDDKESCAADIKCSDPVYRYHLLKALFHVGFKRVLVYKTFIHVDLDLSKDQNIVSYMA